MTGRRSSVTPRTARLTSPVAGTTAAVLAVLESAAASTYRMIRAGFPTTTAFAGTDRVTTAPAPTIAPRPMVRPGRIVAFAPIEAPWRTVVTG